MPIAQPVVPPYEPIPGPTPDWRAPVCLSADLPRRGGTCPRVAALDEDVYVWWISTNVWEGDRLVFRRSGDRGLSWEPIVNLTPAGHDWDFKGLEVAVDAADVVHLIFTARATGGGAHEKWAIYHASSGDYGTSWDGPDEVSVFGGQPKPASVAAVGDSIYVIWDDNREEGIVTLGRAWAEGAWGMPTIIEKPPDSGGSGGSKDHFGFPMFSIYTAVLAGELHLFRESPVHSLWHWIWDSATQTWRSPHPRPGPFVDATVAAAAAVGDRILVAYGGEEGLNDHGLPTYALHTLIGAEGGRSWSGPHIATKPSWQFHCPSNPMFLPTADALYMVGRVGIGDGTEAAFAISLDAGDTWSPVFHICPASQLHACVSGSTVYLLCEEGGAIYMLAYDPAEDIIPPAEVALSAEPGPGAGTISVRWIAPGDDQHLGRADRYVVKCAEGVIRGAETWLAAVEVPGAPTPADPGTEQECVMTGLTPGREYHFAVVTIDDAGNISFLSNSPTATAP